MGRYANHGFQALAGGQAVLKALRSHGFRGTTAERAMEAAVRAWTETGAPAADVALRDVARRVALGLASITALIDPEMVVLTGEVLLAGGNELRGRIEHQLHMMTIPRPPLRISAVAGNPVLAGALEHALSVTREELLGSPLHQ
jgi:predicted NBD/HSP70 family sugar kinase